MKTALLTVIGIGLAYLWVWLTTDSDQPTRPQ